jgi:hypothetical protein
MAILAPRVTKCTSSCCIRNGFSEADLRVAVKQSEPATYAELIRVCRVEQRNTFDAAVADNQGGCQWIDTLKREWFERSDQAGPVSLFAQPVCRGPID